MTRTAFLDAYRSALLMTYAWATDTTKLNNFLANVENTLATPRITWVWDGPNTTLAWKAIGGKGKPTLKALRGLPT